VNSLSFSPDGKSLASGSSDKTIRIWDPQNGQERTTLSGHSGGITNVVYSPDG
jgi:WD40 repeat protein